jgi:hypothetical protein
MTDRKTFTGSADRLSDHEVVRRHGLMVNLTRAPDKTKTMNVLFSLATPADQTAELEAAVAAGRTVPRDALQKYGADPSDADRLTAG